MLGTIKRVSNETMRRDSYTDQYLQNCGSTNSNIRYRSMDTDKEKTKTPEMKVLRNVYACTIM